MDPEQRVAGELFGDLVAVGNAALAQLFRMAVRTQTTPLLRADGSHTGIFPAIPAAPRPGTVPLPTGQLPTGPLFRPKSPPPPPDLAPTSKLTTPSRQNGSNGNGHGAIEDYSASRALVCCLMNLALSSAKRNICCGVATTKSQLQRIFLRSMARLPWQSRHPQMIRICASCAGCKSRARARWMPPRLRRSSPHLRLTRHYQSICHPSWHKPSPLVRVLYLHRNQMPQHPCPYPAASSPPSPCPLPRHRTRALAQIRRQSLRHLLRWTQQHRSRQCRPPGRHQHSVAVPGRTSHPPLRPKRCQLMLLSRVPLRCPSLSPPVEMPDFIHARASLAAHASDGGPPRAGTARLRGQDVSPAPELPAVAFDGASANLAASMPSVERHTLIRVGRIW